MKAIIEIGGRGSALKRARGQLTAARTGQAADYHLAFASTQVLFSELTPARIAALEYLRQHGPLSIYALTKGLERNYSNVHADVGKLIEHHLAQKDAQGGVFVPWDAVEIRLNLARAA